MIDVNVETGILDRKVSDCLYKFRGMRRPGTPSLLERNRPAC